MNKIDLSSVAVIALFIIRCGCTDAAEAAPLDQINFDKLEQIGKLGPLHWFENSDKQEVASEAQVKRYLNQRFPAGSPLKNAIDAMSDSNGRCSFFNDKFGPPGYFCDFSHRGPGSGVFVLEYDWSVIVYYEKNTNRIISVSAVQSSTGP